MLLGEVGGVALLEAGVLDRTVRQAPEEEVHPLDQVAELPALLDEGARDKGGALGEEVQDVQTGAGQQLGVEGDRVLAEEADQLTAAGLDVQGGGQGLVAQAYGLDVVELQPAQGVQRQLQGVGDGLQLGVVQWGFPGLAGRAVHQLADQLA